jgi:hypothetical protein
MPKRIVKTPVQVFREGKFIEPAVGEVYDFTDKEIKELTTAKADCLDHPQTGEPMTGKVVLADKG